MVRRTFQVLALGFGLALSAGAASAATGAVVTNDLNIRTGPSANYQRYGTIPAGDEVVVFGCLRGYNWCDVSWDGERGWVHGAYLAYMGRRYNREPIPRVAVRVGVPVYGFDPYDYHRRYYAGRPWYRDRYLDGPRRDRDFDRPRRDRDFEPPRRDRDFDGFYDRPRPPRYDERVDNRDRDRDRDFDRDRDRPRRDRDFDRPRDDREFDAPRRPRDRDEADSDRRDPDRRDRRDPDRFDPRRGDEDRAQDERPRKLPGGSAEAARISRGEGGPRILPPND